MHVDIQTIGIAINMLAHADSDMLGGALEEQTQMLTCQPLRDALAALATQFVKEGQQVELNVAGRFTITMFLIVLLQLVFHGTSLEHFVVLAFIVNIVFIYFVRCVSQRYPCRLLLLVSLLVLCSISEDVPGGNGPVRRVGRRVADLVWIDRIFPSEVRWVQETEFVDG